MTVSIPNPTEPIIDRHGRMSLEWRRYFQNLGNSTVNLTRVTQEITQTINEAPDVHLGTVIGLDGIKVYGSLSTTLKIGLDGGGNPHGSSITVSDTAPTDPENGEGWVDTTDGTFYIWYDDGSSAQWVAFGSAGGAGGAEGVPYEVSATYAVESGQQALFSMPITLLSDDATLDVSGYLIEVS